MRLLDAVRPGEQGTYRRHLCRHREFAGAHVHDYLELFWVEKGPGIHWINGEKRVLSPGILQLVRAEDAHGFYAMDGLDFEWTNVAFFPSSWRALRKRYYSTGMRFFDVEDPASREFSMSNERLAALRYAAGDLARGSRDRLTFERFLLNVLAVLDDNGGLQPAVPVWLAGLEQELRQQANFSRGVSAVVAGAGRCPEHVCREFRRYFGKTPTAVMGEARMEFAASQLATTGMKIVDLALEVGMENLGHFYRCFEKHFECTPRQYRLRQLRTGRVPTPVVS